MKKIIFFSIISLICARAQGQWQLTGNAGTNSSTNFIGTTDNINFKIRTKNIVRITITAGGKVGIGTTAPVFKLDVKSGSINTDSLYRIGGTTVLSVKGTSNTFVGSTAGYSNTTGYQNTVSGNSALYSNTSGYRNTAKGFGALYSNSTGYENTANGYRSLYFNSNGLHNTANGVEALYSNTTGNENTANGTWTLHNNTSASENTAIGNYALAVQSYNPGSGWASCNTAVGYTALFYNQPTSTGNGINNTAVGHSALYNNTTGDENTAIGKNALYSNTTGAGNTANGINALYSNTTGGSNAANGNSALYSNTTGGSNTASGRGALYANTSGNHNVAVGLDALTDNTTASENTAIGNEALYYQSYNPGAAWISANVAVGENALHLNQPTTAANGINNTAVGHFALSDNTTGAYNTAIGKSALSNNTTGNYNTAVGRNAKTSAGNLNNSIVIGDNASVNASDKVRIGDAGVTVFETQTGAWQPSDGRFKENVKEDVKGLDFIMKLQPVSYNFNRLKFAQHVKQHSTPEKEATMAEQSKIRTVGFIAQDVEKIIKQTGFTDFDAVHAPTNETDNYSMGYAAFVVPLVKAVQELSKENDDMKSEVRNQKSEIEIIKSVLSSDQKQKFDAIRNENKVVLEQNLPNPFSLETEIKFQLPSIFGSAHLIITDANGKQIRSIDLKSSSSVIIKASELSGGTYSYSLVIDGVNVDAKQMILTK